MIEILLLVLIGIFVIGGVVLAIGGKNRYFRMLSRDMENWQQKGWVTSEAARSILNEKRPEGIGGRLVFLVGLLGAILLLFAAISFVAANWDDMSRLSRLTWLMVVLWMAFLTGWRLMANDHPHLAEIAYLLGVGLFGVNITLIAQMFHIDSHPPNGVLMWTIGALVSAVLLQSRAALVLTFFGAIAWSLMETIAYGALIHWPFLLVWAPAFALTLWLNWSYAWHLAFLSLLTWTIIAVIRYAIEGHWAPHGVLSLFVMAFLFMLAIAFILQANRSTGEDPAFEHALEKYAILGLLPAIFALQTIPLKLASTLYDQRSPNEFLFYMLQGALGWLPFTVLLLIGTLILLVLTYREKLLHIFDLGVFAVIAGSTLAFSLVSMPELFFTNGEQISKGLHDFLATWIYGAAFLALLIWLIDFGHRRGSDLYVWAALFTFAAEVLYVYFRIFGSLLETSLFFLVGGLLTMGLAFFLYRLHQRLDDDPRSLKGITS